MKVLFTNFFGFNAGGAEKSSSLTAKALEEKGVEVVFASTAAFPNAEVKRFGAFPPLVFFQKNYLKGKLSEIIQSERIDLVHGQDRLTSFASVLAAESKGIPVVLHFRDYWFDCVKSTRLKPDFTECNCSMQDIMASFPFYRVPWEYLKISSIRKNLQLLNYADKKIAISEAVKKQMELAGIGENTSIVPNPVDLKAFDEAVPVDLEKEFGAKGKVVLFVGRLSYEKGLSNLLKVIESVTAHEKKTFFLIVGSGPMEKELREKIRNKGILGNTKIAGHVSYEKLMGIYKACDMVVFPSVWQEPFGRVSVEAMAAGKAVVASRVGGINETIEDNVNGFLVEPNNIGQWQNRIVELLADDIKRNKFGRKGRETVKQKFDKMVIAKKILEQYKEVL